MSEIIKTFKQAERDAIVAAMRGCRSTTDAAKALGIGRATLYRRIKAHGFTKYDFEISIQDCRPDGKSE